MKVMVSSGNSNCKKLDVLVARSEKQGLRDIRKLSARQCLRKVISWTSAYLGDL